MLFCLGQASLFAQQEAPRFRLEWSNQTIFTQGNILVISPDLEFYVDKKAYNNANHLSGFWRLGNRLELGIGLGYASRDAYLLGTTCPIGSFCAKPSAARIIGYTRIRSLEIPVELRWKYWKSAKRIAPYFLLGIANRIPVLSPSFYYVEKTRLSPKNYAMGVILGTGAQIKIFEEWSLFFEVKIRKDSNFRFEKRSRFEGIEWFNEGVIKIGIGRNF